MGCRIKFSTVSYFLGRLYWSLMTLGLHITAAALNVYRYEWAGPRPFKSGFSSFVTYFSSHSRIRCGTYREAHPVPAVAKARRGSGSETIRTCEWILSIRLKKKATRLVRDEYDEGISLHWASSVKKEREKEIL